MLHHYLPFFLKTLLLAWIATVQARGRAAEPPGVHATEQVDTAELTRRVGALRDQGEYTKAIEAGRSAVTIAEKRFGPDDRRTGAAQRALAAAYLEIGDTSAAAPLLRAAIAVLERADPPEPAALSYAVGDLAQAVGSDDEAERLYRRALELAEQATGPEHSATGHALNNLGWFLYSQNRPQEAEQLMRRALHIRERTDGLADPSTAQSLCTLGAIAGALGDITVAESLVRRSLDIRRIVLPKGHPDMAESCSRLAQILLGQGKERAHEALDLATEAFDIYRRTFGPTAIRTLVVMHLKADLLALLGRHTESERLHEDLIAKYETLPGSHLASVADAVGDFGEHMLNAGKPDKAVELYRRALSLQRKAHGEDDIAVVAIRQRLADALYANMKIEDAVKEGRAVLAALDRNAGDPQAATGVALYSLAKYLLATGGMEEARPLLRRSMSVFERTTGRGSRETLQVIFLLASTFIVMDEFREAELLVDDGLQRFADQDDVRTGSIAGDLIGLRAVIYRRTGRLKEAEEAEAIAKRVEADEQRR
jgi:Tfp pilus assembly protein PilF